MSTFSLISIPFFSSHSSRSLFVKSPKITRKTKFHDITYDEVLKRGLKVMDLTATCMCKENNLPIVVFDMDTVGNLKKVISGEEIGTIVHN